MKQIICLLIILGSIKTVRSQSANVTWGPDLGKPKKTEIGPVIGAYKDSFYALRRGTGLFNSGEIYLERYSTSTLRLETIRPIKLLGINGRRLTFERAFVIDAAILVFLSYYDKEQDRNIAYVQKLDAADCSIISPSREVDFIPDTRKRDPGSFDFMLSKNGSLILILHQDPFGKHKVGRLSFKVLNAEADELWLGSVELPYGDREFKISNYALADDGKLLMLVSLPAGIEKGNKKPHYLYELLTYEPRSKSLKQRPLDFGNKFISDIAFNLRGKDTVLIGGFYSNSSTGGLGGSFFISLNVQSQDILVQASEDFTTGFLQEFMSKKNADKHKDLYNYNIDYLLAKKDGGVYILAEQYYMFVSTYYSRYGSTYTYHYYYNDIIVVNINPDGSTAWVKKIPKYQHSTNDNGFYSSYALHTEADKLYLFFNDNPKNLNPGSKKIRPAFAWKTIAVMASLDPNGTIKKEPLRIPGQGGMLRPKTSLDLPDNKTLIYALKRKSFKFGLISNGEGLGPRSQD